MMDYLPNLLLAWGVQMTGILSPGPGVALILGVATAQGRGPALLTSLGIACGSIVLAVATVLGIAAIFAQISEAMTIVRLLGACYLAWLAWGSFRKALAPPALEAVPPTRRSALRQGLRGFVLQLSNPKAIFFWLAIAALGSLQDAPAHVLAVFVLGAFLNSLAGHAGYALLLSAGPVRRAYLHARRWIEAALGTFFAFASYRLATSET